jgi:putative SOS response-associated peptidase YedK
VSIRAIVIADQPAAGHNQSHHHALRVLNLALLVGATWPHDPSATATAFTCCLVPTTPNEVVKPFHDRMPAILTPEEYTKWFDHDDALAEVQALLKPLPTELMTVSEANVLANSPRNEGPQLLEPAA